MGMPAIALKQLAEELQSKGLSSAVVTRFAAEIAAIFKVKENDVGILRLDKQTLHFIHPAKLAQVGAIPMNTPAAVAARVVTSKRAELINNLAQLKHASIFESVELHKKLKIVGQQVNPDDRLSQVVQKMLSVPVICEGAVVGVIEVCRKGKSAPDAGPDFTAADLQMLVTIAASLAKCFKP
jgi:GAF domain-containing protein